MTWTKSASNDVVGYRVYQVVNGNRVLITTKLEAENYSHQITSPGQYVVVTVDITGLQSGASNITTLNAPDPVIPVLPPEEPVGEEPEQPTPGDGNGGGGDVIITPPVEPTTPEEESTP